MNYKILSGSTLKVIALICMIVDHTTKTAVSVWPWMRCVLFTVGSVKITPAFIGASVALLRISEWAVVREQVRWSSTARVSQQWISQVVWAAVHVREYVLMAHQSLRTVRHISITISVLAVEDVLPYVLRM